MTAINLTMVHANVVFRDNIALRAVVYRPASLVKTNIGLKGAKLR